MRKHIVHIQITKVENDKTIKKQKRINFEKANDILPPLKRK